MSKFLFLIISLASAQLISMSVCSDNSCSQNCVQWTATSGKCSSCDSSKGSCSISNPSSIVTLSSYSFYSDASCNNVINGTKNMAFKVDGSCQILNAYGYIPIGSAKGSNLSVTIGVSIGIILIIIIGIIVFLKMKKLCCFKDRNISVNNYIEPTPSAPPQVMIIEPHPVYEIHPPSYPGQIQSYPVQPPVYQVPQPVYQVPQPVYQVPQPVYYGQQVHSGQQVYPVQQKYPSAYNSPIL